MPGQRVRSRFGGKGRAMPPPVVAEVQRRYRGGERRAVIAGDVGVTITTVSRVVAKAGGMPPPRWKDRSPLHLSVAEREEISRGLAEGLSFSDIGVRLGRHKGTISREVNSNGSRTGYRAWRADERACELARRPKPTVFERSPRLAAYVEEKLMLKWSPTQISARLIVDHPDDEEMRVSPETIYQTLFVQGRGGLRKELAKHLRSGRTKRKAHGRTSSHAPIRDMVPISERPPEIADRAVPGHWEGDLIIGANGQSAIATLVERTSRLTMLGALPEGRTADKVRDVLEQLIQRLPEHMRRTLTWDQGREMAEHTSFSIASGVQVYFCDPHSPWQRGSNENTNGLLRQYFPKGTSLSGYTQADLDAVADELNGRPRQTLGWMTPSEAFNQFVAIAA
jgi:IS30 family transposase